MTGNSDIPKKTRRQWPRTSSITWFPIALLVGMLFGALGHAAWPIELGAVQEWLYSFSTSAGLGGVAALVAASIAYRGVIRSAQTARDTSLATSEVQRSTAELAQWWENARWASDRLLSVSSEEAGLDSDDATVAILSDRDALAAIEALHHLGENAPSDSTAAFIQKVLGTALGLDTTGDDGSDLTDSEEGDHDEGH